MEETEAARVEKLRSIPLFAGCSDESLRSLLGIATEFEADTGHVLIQPNQPGAGLFVLEEGSVVVERSGRRIDLGAGEFFGELALLDERAHTGRVSATSRIRCLAIRRDDFDRLLDAEPKLAVAMLRTLARRLAQTAT